MTGVVKLAAVEWYSGSGGYVQPNCPVLAVVFDNGRAQLMCHELDDSKPMVGGESIAQVKCCLLSDPILLETHMSVTCVQWSHTGSLLAFGGTQKFQDGKELCCVQFYSTFGQVECACINMHVLNACLQILYTLRVPGRNLCAVSWEGTGLRVAMAVGPHIYFANIRHDYKWGFFSNTVVYAFKKLDRVSVAACPGDVVSVAACPDDVVSVAACPGDVVSVAACPDDVVSVTACPGDVVSVAACPDDVVSVAACPGDVGSVAACPGDVGSVAHVLVMLYPGGRLCDLLECEHRRETCQVSQELAGHHIL